MPSDIPNVGFHTPGPIVAQEDDRWDPYVSCLTPRFQDDSAAAQEDIQETSHDLCLAFPFRDSPAATNKNIRKTSHAPYLTLIPRGWSNGCSYYIPLLTILVFVSLPHRAAASNGTPLHAENHTSPTITTALFTLIALGIAFTIATYFAEFKKTLELPKFKPEIPDPVNQPITNSLNPYHRNLIFNTATIVWLLLSVAAVAGAAHFQYSAISPSSCDALNPDIAGMGVRLSLWIPGAIVMLIAGLGHFHAEETGVKTINMTLLGAIIYYSWNLSTKQMAAVDMLLSTMILDSLTSVTSITFSMKECLAARQLIRVGLLVQLFALFVLAGAMRKLHDDNYRGGLGASSDSCPCFQAYWWGPVDTCNGASPTFWLYFTLKVTTFIHNAWLCLWYMEHYDAAEKSARDDKNTSIDIPKTVYDSIPATAFTKYQELIPTSFASMITIELTLAGTHFQGSEDVSSWGQTAQLVVTIVTFSFWCYGVYSMFKEKNVRRRQEVLNQSSIGSLIPKLYIQRPRTWLGWLKQIPKIAYDDHPFGKLPLRAVNHARIEFNSEAWKKIENRFLRWPDKSPRELGVILISEAEFGDVGEVRQLLLENANVNEANDSGQTALMVAVENRHVKVVELLLEEAIDIMMQNKDGQTALHTALSSKLIDDTVQKLVKLLLDKTIDISTQGKDGQTALHLATARRMAEVVELLLEKTTDISAQDKNGWTALHLAAMQGMTEVVKLLLEKTTDISAQDKNGRTALHLAAMQGMTEVVKLLLEKTTDISAQDKDGQTVLHLATEFRMTEVVKLLLEKTTDISAQGKNGRTALHLAAKRGMTEVVKLLLEKTTDISAQDKDKQTVLHLTTEFGMTVPHIATLKNWANPKIIELLNTANINTQDLDGRTALHNAASYGRGTAVKLLLQRGANTSISNSNGKPAIWLTSRNRYRRIVSPFRDKARKRIAHSNQKRRPFGVRSKPVLRKPSVGNGSKSILGTPSMKAT